VTSKSSCHPFLLTFFLTYPLLTKRSINTNGKISDKKIHDVRNSLQNIASSDSFSIAKRESDPQVAYGYNSLPYSLGGGFYRRSLAYHDFRYPYVVGYGPRAYTYGYRTPTKKM
jgi:hypothetical protein